MFWIKCPFCGERPQAEFTYSGDGLRHAPNVEAVEENWFSYVYEREDPKGIHVEHWHHTQGCRHHVSVIRNTLTHEILETGLAKDHIVLAKKYNLLAREKS